MWLGLLIRHFAEEGVRGKRAQIRKNAEIYLAYNIDGRITKRVGPNVFTGYWLAPPPWMQLCFTSPMTALRLHLCRVTAGRKTLM